MSDETIKIITSNFEATAEPVSGQKSILAAGMYYFGDEDEDTEETPEESPQSSSVSIQDLSTSKLEQELTKFMQSPLGLCYVSPGFPIRGRVMGLTRLSRSPWD